MDEDPKHPHHRRPAIVELLCLLLCDDLIRPLEALDGLLDVDLGDQLLPRAVSEFQQADEKDNLRDPSDGKILQRGQTWCGVMWGGSDVRGGGVVW